MKRRLLVLVGALMAPLVLVSCGGSDDEGDSTSQAASDACDGATINFIGLEGEEGKVELEDWRNERDMKLANNWPGDWAQLIAAIKVGQPFELSTIPYHWAQRMIAAGIVQPIDTDKLENWDLLAPGLRESPSLRGEDGQVYGVPIAWGDAPFVYSPERVDSPPQSITDLMDPSWKGRFVMYDAPDSPFYLLAKAHGFDEAPLLTQEQLEIVAADAEKIVDNAAAFQSNYQDATDRLINGDIDLAVGGWEAMVSWANEKGVTLDFGFFDEGRHGWWDGLAIPSTSENVDCAYAYIDEMIATDVQAEIATNLVSGAANLEAAELVKGDAKSYDYDVVSGGANSDDFASSTPPEKVPDGYASYQDWLDAWQEIKS